MIPNVDFVRNTFFHFKRTIDEFNGIEIPFNFKFTVRKMKRTNGYVRYNRSIDGKITPYMLCISSTFDVPKEFIEDTILHEMIHLYCMNYNLIDGAVGHGKSFVKIMNDLNKKYNRNIDVVADFNDIKDRIVTTKVSTFIRFKNSRGITVIYKIYERKMLQFAKFFAERGFTIIDIISSNHKSFAFLPEHKTFPKVSISSLNYEKVCNQITNEFSVVMDTETLNKMIKL